jgi:hypothetical protein
MVLDTSQNLKPTTGSYFLTTGYQGAGAQDRRMP